MQQVEFYTFYQTAMELQSDRQLTVPNDAFTWRQFTRLEGTMKHFALKRLQFLGEQEGACRPHGCTMMERLTPKGNGTECINRAADSHKTDLHLLLKDPADPQRWGLNCMATPTIRRTPSLPPLLVTSAIPLTQQSAIPITYERTRTQQSPRSFLICPLRLLLTDSLHKFISSIFFATRLMKC